MIRMLEGLALLAAMAAPAQAASHYVYMALPPLTSIGAGQAFSINAAGDVVGNAAASQFAGHGVLWHNGVAKDLGSGRPNNPFDASSAAKITDAGRIVGDTGFKNHEPPHAAFYDNGRWVDIGTGYASPKSFSSFSSANDNGDAVGIRSPKIPDVAHYKLLRTEAFIWNDASFRSITLGGRNGAAFGVNAAGVVVGQSETADRVPHAFRWQAGHITDLGAAAGVKAGAQSRARAVNSAGVVVGFGVARGGTAYHALRWDGAGATDLGALTADGSAEAEGINDAGTIVGEANDPQGHATAFVVRNGMLIDLNTITRKLPRTVVLAEASAISPSGVIVGTTCSQACPEGAPPQTAFMLVPVD